MDVDLVGWGVWVAGLVTTVGTLVAMLGLARAGGRDSAVRRGPTLPPPQDIPRSVIDRTHQEAQEEIKTTGGEKDRLSSLANLLNARKRR